MYFFRSPSLTNAALYPSFSFSDTVTMSSSESFLSFNVFSSKYFFGSTSSGSTVGMSDAWPSTPFSMPCMTDIRSMLPFSVNPIAPPQFASSYPI